ncbi:hypothetical protein AK36_6147 (plasmid) [Burkholderia vietnamiensis LMG 10929]|nr:hypothetical protein AK36_6147 [Burkholderia vietnamiensis LMG 10929]
MHGTRRRTSTFRRRRKTSAWPTQGQAGLVGVKEKKKWVMDLIRVFEMKRNHTVNASRRKLQTVRHALSRPVI